MKTLASFQGQKHSFFAWIPHNSVKLSCSICFSLATVCRSLQTTLNMFSTGFNSADLGGSLTISALAHSQVILAALEFWQGSLSWINKKHLLKLLVNERGKNFPVMCSYSLHTTTPASYEVATRNFTTLPPVPTLLPLAVQNWFNPSDFFLYILPVGALTWSKEFVF